jgi:hypothetical protein
MQFRLKLAGLCCGAAIVAYRIEKNAMNGITKTRQCNEVTVTNTTTQAIWVTHKFADAPTPPLPTNYNVRVTAEAAHPPPAGFFNNPAHRFVVRGHYLQSDKFFVSGPATYNAGDSDPPDVYTLSV